jgi:filamentous hemagglutinin
LGIPYDKDGTGVWDKIANGIVEAFSGSHDFMGNHLGMGYDEYGFTNQGVGTGREMWANFMSVVDIPLAAPFALSTLVAPEMVPFLQAYYNSLRK